MKVHFDGDIYLFEAFVKFTDLEGEYPKLIRKPERARELLPRFLKYIGAESSGDIMSDAVRIVATEELTQSLITRRSYLHYFYGQKGILVGRINKNSGCHYIFDYQDFEAEHREFIASKQ